jgi:hypothetical protein
LRVPELFHCSSMLSPVAISPTQNSLDICVFQVLTFWHVALKLFIVHCSLQDMEGRSISVNYPQPRGAAGATRERAPRDSFGAGGGRGAGRAPRDDTNKLFVGNLSWGMDDMGLQDVFSEFGTVTSARVITDRETGRSRGFGFVTMSSTDETTGAVSGLDGQEVDGRRLRVNMADSKPDGGGGGGGYGVSTY